MLNGGHGRSLPEGERQHWGGRNGLQPTRPAKVVPMSVAGSDSGRAIHERCNGNRERATSGQEQQERRGSSGRAEGEPGGLAGEQSGGSVVTNRSRRRQDALSFRA